MNQSTEANEDRMSEAEMLDLARANILDRRQQGRHQECIDKLKAEIKNLKVENDALDFRIAERDTAIDTGVRYVPADERQTMLTFDLANTALDSIPPPGIDDSESGLEDEDDEGGDLEDQLALADAEDRDSTSGFGGAHPDDGIDGASVMLAAAQGGAEPAMSKPPSKPSRKGRKAVA